MCGKVAGGRGCWLKVGDKDGFCMGRSWLCRRVRRRNSCSQWEQELKSNLRFPRSLLNVGAHWLVGTLVTFQLYIQDGYFYFGMINSVHWENYFFEEECFKEQARSHFSSTPAELLRYCFCPTWPLMPKSASRSWWFQTVFWVSIL